MKNEIKQTEQIDEIKNILLAYQPLIDIQYDAFGVIAEALVKSGFSNNSDHIAEREMLSSENKELENALKQSEDNYSRAFERLKAQQREIDTLKAKNKVLGDGVAKAYTNGFTDGRKQVEKDIKQAKIDVLTELKEKCKFDGHTVAVYKNDIEEMIKEVENDKGRVY